MAQKRQSSTDLLEEKIRKAQEDVTKAKERYDQTVEKLKE